jgi:hypothetical protein
VFGVRGGFGGPNREVFALSRTTGELYAAATPDDTVRAIAADGCGRSTCEEHRVTAFAP